MTIRDSLIYADELEKNARSSRRRFVYQPSKVLHQEEDIENVDPFLYDLAYNLENDIFDLTDDEFQVLLSRAILGMELSTAAIIQIDSDTRWEDLANLSDIETVATPGSVTVYELAIRKSPEEPAILWKRLRN